VAFLLRPPFYVGRRDKERTPDGYNHAHLLMLVVTKRKTPDGVFFAATFLCWPHYIVFHMSQ
jgi:hypothetical protein